MQDPNKSANRHHSRALRISKLKPLIVSQERARAVIEEKRIEIIKEIRRVRRKRFVVQNEEVMKAVTNAGNLVRQQRPNRY